MVRTKAPAGAGEDDPVRHANLQLMDKNIKPSIYVCGLFQACIFSIAPFIPLSIAFVASTLST